MTELCKGDLGQHDTSKDIDRQRTRKQVTTQVTTSHGRDNANIDDDTRIVEPEAHELILQEELQGKRHESFFKSACVIISLVTDVLEVQLLKFEETINQ